MRRKDKYRRGGLSKECQRPLHTHLLLQDGRAENKSATLLLMLPVCLSSKQSLTQNMMEMHAIF